MPMFSNTFHICWASSSPSICVPACKQLKGWQGNPATYRATRLCSPVMSWVKRSCPFLSTTIARLGIVNPDYCMSCVRLEIGSQKDPKKIRPSICEGVGKFLLAKRLAVLLISLLDLSWWLWLGYPLFQPPLLPFVKVMKLNPTKDTQLSKWNCWKTYWKEC